MRARPSVMHCRNLVPMAQAARKPIFQRIPADRAICGHASADKMSRLDCKVLAKKILEKTGLVIHSDASWGKAISANFPMPGVIAMSGQDIRRQRAVAFRNA